MGPDRPRRDRVAPHVRKAQQARVGPQWPDGTQQARCGPAVARAGPSGTAVVRAGPMRTDVARVARWDRLDTARWQSKHVPDGTFVFNDKTGQVLDTDAKMFDLSTLVTGGRGSYTYDADAVFRRMVTASVTEAGILSVALAAADAASAANFPYSDFSVAVTVSDGDDMDEAGRCPCAATRRRRGRPPPATDAITASKVVGTQHPHGFQVKVPAAVIGGLHGQR